MKITKGKLKSLIMEELERFNEGEHEEEKGMMGKKASVKRLEDTKLYGVFTKLAEKYSIDDKYEISQFVIDLMGALGTHQEDITAIIGLLKTYAPQALPSREDSAELPLDEE